MFQIKKSYISDSKTFEFSQFISYQTTRFPKLNPFQVLDLLNMKAIQVLQKTVHEKNMTEVRREIQTKIKAYMRRNKETETKK